MNHKRTQKSKVTAAKELSPAPETAQEAAPPSASSFRSPPVMSEGPRGEIIYMPPPDGLLIEAEQEPDYRALEEYTDVISTLRNKGFSYREISEWLSKRGVEADHNAVYRVYTNSLSEAEVRDEALREQHEAEEEAMRRG